MSAVPASRLRGHNDRSKLEALKHMRGIPEAAQAEAPSEAHTGADDKNTPYGASSCIHGLYLESDGFQLAANNDDAIYVSPESRLSLNVP